MNCSPSICSFVTLPVRRNIEDIRVEKWKLREKMLFKHHILHNVSNMFTSPDLRLKLSSESNSLALFLYSLSRILFPFRFLSALASAFIIFQSDPYFHMRICAGSYSNATHFSSGWHAICLRHLNIQHSKRKSVIKVYLNWHYKLLQTSRLSLFRHLSSAAAKRTRVLEETGIATLMSK